MTLNDVISDIVNSSVYRRDMEEFLESALSGNSFDSCVLTDLQESLCHELSDEDLSSLLSDAFLDIIKRDPDYKPYLFRAVLKSDRALLKEFILSNVELKERLDMAYQNRRHDDFDESLTLRR